MKIYVASSWKNTWQPGVVADLKGMGHAVYDFKDSQGFHWSEVDPTYYDGWTGEEWEERLNHPAAERGFNRDMEALSEADCVIMVTPCGISASLELGYAVGANKYTAIFIPTPHMPELMFKMADRVITDHPHLYAWVEKVANSVRTSA